MESCSNPDCDNLFKKRYSSAKFCSRSCAAKVNNARSPKRKPQGACSECGKPIWKSRVYCADCRPVPVVQFLCKNGCGAVVEKRNRSCKPCATENVLAATQRRVNSKINSWLSGEWDGGVGKDRVISVAVRKYMIEKFDGRCQNRECPVPGGFRGRHPVTGNFVIEVEHIDGNSRNHKEENLTLLCPICHSMTATYRALNKNSGRSSRRKNESG